MSKQETISEKLIAEIKKCKTDIYYFIENYVYIIGLDHQTGKKARMKLKLFDYQKKYIHLVLNNKYSILDKPRQTGFSQVSAAICLWYASFKPNKEVAIVSINDNEAMYFLNRTRFMYDECPKWLVGNLVKANEHIMKFDNGSIIEAVATTKRSLRGRSPALVFIDEIAFNQFADEMMTAAMPSLVHGEHIVLISTRNGTEGIGNYYYRTLESAKTKENDFNCLEVDWWECPLYNKKAPEYTDWKTNEWALSQYKVLGEKAFRQEILKEWILSGDTVLNQNILEKLKHKTPIRTDFVKPVDLTPDDAEKLNEAGWDESFLYAKGFWVWEEPQKNHYYVVGCDLSTGRGDDYSSAQVIDVNTMSQVAEYKYRIPTGMFAKLILEIGKYYNNAFVSIETNSDETAVNYLEDMGYESIYYRLQNKKLIAGWNTNNKTRGLLVGQLQDTMVNERIGIVSYRLISELKTFVYRLGRPQHAKKCNDDLVFGFMIGDYVIEDYVNQHGIDINLATRRDQATGEKNKINMPIPPDISGSRLDSSEKKLIIDQQLEQKPIDISTIGGGNSLSDQYDINTEHYPFIGIKRPQKT